MATSSANEGGLAENMWEEGEDEIDEEASWEDWECEEGEDAFAPSGVESLVSETVHRSVEGALDEAEREGLAVREWLRSLAFLDGIRAVNLVRKIRRERQGKARDVAEEAEKRLQSREWQASESLLQPELEEDPVLMAVGQYEQEGAWEEDEGGGIGLASLGIEGEGDVSEMRRLELLRMADEEGPLRNESVEREGAPSTGKDDSYFESYGHMDIHRQMLEDAVRTGTYRQAIESNPALIEGSRVLDVGCGCGILALFAARAGCERAVGVEASKNAAEVARRVVSANGMGEGVSIVEGRLEEVCDRAELGEEFDVIVSEWMGYCLLAESMLGTVIHARDNFLRQGGCVLPDIAELYIAGITRRGAGMDFYDSVYGFDLSPAADKAIEIARRSAVISDVKPDGIVTDHSRILSLDLMSCSSVDGEFSADFILNASCEEPRHVCALCLWFDASFSSRFCNRAPLTLSTSPQADSTHWSQTILFLKEPIAVSSSSSPSVGGRLSIGRAGPNRRSLAISLEAWPIDSLGREGAGQASYYEL